MNDPFFTNPTWYRPDRPPLHDELAMDLSLRSGELTSALIHFAEDWCRQTYGTTGVELTEGPCDIPIACPNDCFAYLIGVRVPEYPQGALLFLIVDRAETLCGVRLEP